MSVDLNSIITQIGKEKGIERGVLVEAVESAMLSAARRHFGHSLNLEVQFNVETGELEVVQFKAIVDRVYDESTQISVEEAREYTQDNSLNVGDEVGLRLDTAELGRIAAQTAKQVIIQKVRDAERGVIFEEFKDTKGELINGIVLRYERGNLIVNLGRTEAILPRREQILREKYRQGDRIRSMILDIDRSARGPQIVLTRSHPDFLKKLFEGEVQEISEGIVQIKACSREPGDRAKIAVISTDSGVDPVGACVGVKGVRVQAVVQELRGERIDIITWTGDEPSFVARALAPAEVSRVIVDEANHTIEVVVADDQLALAIGRRGQNVKLASKLTGWRIDVRSLSVAEEESRRAKASIDAIPGIGFAEATVLFQQGFRSAAEVAESSSEELSTMEGFTEERAKAVYESALNFVESGGDKMASDDEKPLSDLYRLGLNEELMFRLISNGYNTIQALVTAQDFGGGYHSNDERHENGLSEVPRGNTLRNNPNFSDLERDLIREKLEEFLRRRPTVKFS